ncbi:MULTISPECIES: glycine cleavage system protein H [unclassified Jeotgalibaca]|uniref:glycine cleavage system protein H n=1 Tax=unclassified Jeotgalibaca TaxID=2621505 RepID=UPI003FD30CB5
MTAVKFSEEGFWIEKKEDTFVIGLSDKGQDDLGEVSFVDLPSTGAIKKEDVLIGVEAAKAVTELTVPFSGTISEVNSDLEDDPSTLNSNNREETWIVKMTDVSDTDFEALLNESGFEG